MEKTDNTLKILVTVSSILFLLVAIKTSCPAESIGEMTLNIADIFVAFELFLFIVIYVIGPMLSDTMPALWHYCPKIKQNFSTEIQKESFTLSVSNAKRFTGKHKQ